MCPCAQLACWVLSASLLLLLPCYWEALLHHGRIVGPIAITRRNVTYNGWSAGQSSCNAWGKTGGRENGHHYNSICAVVVLRQNYWPAHRVADLLLLLGNALDKQAPGQFVLYRDLAAQLLNLLWPLCLQSVQGAGVV